MSARASIQAIPTSAPANDQRVLRAAVDRYLASAGVCKRHDFRDGDVCSRCDAAKAVRT